MKVPGTALATEKALQVSSLSLEIKSKDLSALWSGFPWWEGVCTAGESESNPSSALQRVMAGVGQ